jgi:glycosyltransferase involved in cell wall biosynthesis
MKEMEPGAETVDGERRYEPSNGATSRIGRETLTVAIPTKNVADLLADCLASVAWADEIVVVDMFSSDHTRAVCSEHPQCRFFQRHGYIEANVNFAFDQATSDWVLRLDSDERITPELASEIQSILADPPKDVTGFEFWERPFILGRELQYGFGRKHYRKLLFRRGAARYPLKHYHEELETSGAWMHGTHSYVHLNYTEVRDYLVKMNLYTDGDALRAELPVKAPGVLDATREAARAFYLYYLKRQGFRDGWIGFLDAGMRSAYQFVYWAKLRERWEREQRMPDGG